MASFQNLYSKRKLEPGFDSNFSVDYVILYKIPEEGPSNLHFPIFPPPG